VPAGATVLQRGVATVTVPWHISRGVVSHVQSNSEVPMLKSIRRVAILVAGVASLLAVSAQAAHAGMSLNHSEPLR
jgi:hypothetical protein